MVFNCLHYRTLLKKINNTLKSFVKENNKQFVGLNLIVTLQSFLEEVAATQEKALKMAASTQQEHLCLQQEAKHQQELYETVILELQAQV